MCAINATSLLALLAARLPSSVCGAVAAVGGAVLVGALRTARPVRPARSAAGPTRTATGRTVGDGTVLLTLEAKAEVKAEVKAEAKAEAEVGASETARCSPRRTCRAGAPNRGRYECAMPMMALEAEAPVTEA